MLLKFGVNCALMTMGRITSHAVKQALSTICACKSSNINMDVDVITFMQLVQYIQCGSNSMSMYHHEQGLLVLLWCEALWRTKSKMTQKIHNQAN